jgi:hypothetical protein
VIHKIFTRKIQDIDIDIDIDILQFMAFRIDVELIRGRQEQQLQALN